MNMNDTQRADKLTHTKTSTQSGDALQRAIMLLVEWLLESDVELMDSTSAMNEQTQDSYTSD